MKKISLVILFILLGIYSFGQEKYRIDVFFSFHADGRGRRVCDSWAKLIFTYDDNTKEEVYYNNSTNYDENLTYLRNKKIKSIIGKGYMRRKNLGFFCRGDEESFNEEILIKDCREGYKNDKGDHHGTSLAYTIRAKLLPLHLLKTEIINNAVYPHLYNTNLPTGDKINLIDYEGFSDSSYNYQYSFDGNNWINIAPSLSNLNVLSISAKDILGEKEYLKHIGEKIYFRVVSCWDGSKYQSWSEPIPLTIIKSSPHILSHEVSATKCFDTKDGAVTLHFDRILEAGETLSLSLENKATGSVVVNKDLSSQLHSGTAYTLETLPPGEYILNLNGSYNGNPTYTDGEKHHIDFEIEKAAPVSFQLSSKTDVYCFDGNDGVINIEAKGGTGIYQYLITKDGKNYLDWTDFNNADKTSIQALSKGIYKIKVRDTHECVAKEPNNSSIEKEVEVRISQPSAPLSIIEKETEIVQPTGYGLSNGYISIMVQGGTPNSDGSYHYEWRKDSPTGSPITTGITTQSAQDTYTIKIDNLTAGKYYLTVKDKNYNAATANLGNCGIVSKEFEVTQPDPLIAKIEVEQDISCNIANEYPFKLDLNENEIPDNAEDGKIESKVTGGVGRYSYQWQKMDNGIFTDISGATASVLKNIKAGTYKILVTDENNNKTNEKIVITYPPKFELAMSSNPISCNAESSGSVSVRATGGTGAYSYEWNTMDTTPEVTGLRAGNYFVLVTDAKNCKIKGNVEITQPDKIMITDEEVRNPICHNSSNGSIKIKITGGTQPYKISWSNGVTTEENTNLPAGDYILTVTDAKGCQEIKEYTLINPEPLRVHIGEDVTLCAGDTQKYDVTIEDKGAIYLWKNEKGEIISQLPTIELSEAGTYTVTVTDSKGCEGTDSVVIKNSKEILDPKFMLTTHAYTESTVVLVNTSPKMPETVEWLIPESAAVNVIDKKEEYLELKFSNTGSYKIGLKGTQGQCKKTFYKEVLVEENLSGVELSTDKISNITEFTIAPNPNDGNFKVIVKLEKENTINLRIINMLTQEVLPVISKAKSTYFLIPYEITLPVGVYFVILETGNESMVKKMIIK